MVALTSWPTNDEPATEDLWIQMARRWFRDGVYLIDDASGMKPVGNSSGMLVRVSPGMGIVYGITYRIDSLSTLTVPAADASNDRIDRIVVRLFIGDHTHAELLLIPGTASQNPIAPSEQRSSTQWDLTIGLVTVPRGASTIRAQDVQDLRIFARPRVIEDAGVVKLWPSSKPIPGNALSMLGQTVQTASYPALARAWGFETSTTFVIPDMTGLSVRGSGPSGVGSIVGSDDVTLTVDNMPSHNHGVNQSPHTHDIGPYRYVIQSFGQEQNWITGLAQAAGGPGNAQVTFTNPPGGSANISIQSAGGGQSFKIIPRSRLFQFIVAAY